MGLNIKKIKAYVFYFLILTVVITVHESGHLFVGRSAGMDMNELNIGFGIPYLEILSLNFNIGEITIHVKPIMLGGYVTALSPNSPKISLKNQYPKAPFCGIIKP